MKLIVGLGNPGPKYAGTRHNVGFMAVDRIAEQHGFGPWRQKFAGDVAEGRLGDEQCVLLKPTTFMNESGQSVGEASRFYKIPAGDVTVFHDDLDLAPGKIRCKTGGGHGGHNGLRSLQAHIGADFVRVRIGIGHPGDKAKVLGHVLGNFAKSDQDWLDQTLDGAADGAPDLAKGRTSEFMRAVSDRAAGKPAAKRSAPDSAAGGPHAEAPPKAESSRPPRGSAPKPATEPETPDERSRLQRLLDRFR